MSDLEWLQNWYAEMCDGDWEHLYGVSIETLDNPGWHVRIDLRETAYATAELSPIHSDNGPTDWLNCSISNHIFDGCGDSSKLSSILATFRACIENHQIQFK